MIGKVKVNQSFGAMCRYVMQEKAPAQEQPAEVLAAHGVRIESAASMATDFDAVRQLRPALGKAVLHVALAFPAEEAGKVTNEVMGRIAQDYLTGLGIQPENTQWAVIRHHDKPHPHMHLVVNRVDLDGQTVSDQFIRSRSVAVCQGIERDYGLIVADQVGRKQAREIGPTPAQVKATTPKEVQSADWSRSRQHIGRALSYTADPARSFEDLAEALRPRGVEMELTRRKDGSPAGVVFIHEGHRVKGSHIERKYSAGQLHQGFARGPEQAQEQAPRLEAAAELKQAADAYALAKVAAEYAKLSKAQQPSKERQPSKDQSRAPSKGYGIGD